MKIRNFEVLHEVSSSLHQSQFLTLMIDKTTDVSNYSLRVTHEMEMCEEFLVAYQVPSIDFSTLTKVSKDALCRHNIPLSKLWDWCYTGASAICMLGASSHKIP